MGILDEIKADPKLTTAAHWEDRNQMRDGVLVRGREEIIHYASQWRVDDQRLNGALAETVHAAGKSRCIPIESRLYFDARTTLNILPTMSRRHPPSPGKVSLFKNLLSYYSVKGYILFTHYNIPALLSS